MNTIDYIRSAMGMGGKAPVEYRPPAFRPGFQDPTPQAMSTGGGFGTPPSAAAPAAAPPPQVAQPQGPMPMVGPASTSGGFGTFTAPPTTYRDGGFHRGPPDSLIGSATTGGGFGTPAAPMRDGGFHLQRPPGAPSPMQDSGFHRQTPAPGGISPPNEISVSAPTRPPWMPQDAWQGPGVGMRPTWYTGGNSNSDHQDRITDLGDGSSGPKFNGIGDFMKNIKTAGTDTGTAGVGLFQSMFGKMFS